MKHQKELKMLKVKAHNLLRKDQNQQVAVVVAQVAVFLDLEVLLVVLHEVWLEVSVVLLVLWVVLLIL